MIRADHPILKAGEYLCAHQPMRLAKGLVSAYVAYPIAERMEHRLVRRKLESLRRFYRRPVDERLRVARESLVESLQFAAHHVPYYKDLFASVGFQPSKVADDPAYLESLPFLTKDIIREQGTRLLSRPLEDLRHYACKTGGSTGQSVVIYYDQMAADHSASVTLFARECIGKSKYRSELHFACRFPDQVHMQWPSREDFKCFAMNRTNIFFDRLDSSGLEMMWQTLCRRRPYLIHEHPSTIYALACEAERMGWKERPFDVFESSGELLQSYMRDKITSVFGCRVVDRYGLAELGVMAYEVDGPGSGLRVFESEGWPESRDAEEGGQELVFTGFRNRLMPLIRFATGDRARVEQTERGFMLRDVLGRIHDVVSINGVPYATHHVMDMLDHRVGGIQEFQIDVRGATPIMRIVPEPGADPAQIAARIDQFWPSGFRVEFVHHDGLIRVGLRSKFRHVVSA